MPTDRDRELCTAQHEAGHATIATVLFPDVVGSVTIVADLSSENPYRRTSGTSQLLAGEKSREAMLVWAFGGIVADTMFTGQRHSEGWLNDAVDIGKFWTAFEQQQTAGMSWWKKRRWRRTQSFNPRDQAEHLLAREHRLFDAIVVGLMAQGTLSREELLALRSLHLRGA